MLKFAQFLSQDVDKSTPFLLILTRTEQSTILSMPFASLYIKVMASVLLAGGNKSGVIRR